uniref:HTH_Tnp_Tc3_1 domain-containing protein n=1 Tax=Caenorhabditis japonica TaxID=281687 RepID=A0A8R1E6C7_CAEJA
MARVAFLTPAERAKGDVMHQLGLKLHEMSRQLGRSRNAIRRYATDPINYGKKQKLPRTTQHPHLLTGKRRNSHQQLYKGLVCFEKNGQLVAQISINRESLWYPCPRHVYRHGKQLNIIQDLKDATRAECDPITEAELKTLVVNMPNWVIEVIQ